MRIIAAAIIVAYLVSCSPPDSNLPPPSEAADEVGEVEPLPRTLPPPGEAPRYVGQWAAASLGCENPAWRFEERRVSTQGEVSCEFNDVQTTATGYTIEATCTAQAPPTQETIQLSFAESARAMMVSGGPWSAAIGLTYCGPLE